MNAPGQIPLPLADELVIDNFAGGGGASTGIEAAIGRPVDIAINHDPEALAMHAANHPHTAHFCESVWDVNPREVTRNQPVGLVWLSPDCKHFSKAKGGKPVEKKIRGLAWVALRWAAVARPRVIMLENVEEFQDWGPLIVDGDGKARPCPKRKGRDFQSFTNALRRQGYQVEWRELRACDYGAPTIRKRLFLVARRDGLPIVWPEPTHGNPASEAVKRGKLLPWRTAAECIDWSLPCPSIFERKRPLAEATMRRIAKGIMRYVVNAAEPFIVKYYGEKSTSEFRGHDMDEPFHTQSTENRFALVQPFITEHANGSSPRNMPADEPLRTQCAQTKGGHFAMVAPTLVATGYGEREGQAPRAPGLDKPLGTVVAGGGKHALVSAFLAQFNTTGNGKPHSGHRPDKPLSTAVASRTVQGLVSVHLVGAGGPAYSGKPKAADEPLGTQTTENHRAVVTSNLVKMRGTNIGQDDREPLHTLSAQGTHFAEVRAFLIKYYGTDQDPQMREPLHTVTTKDRYGLVTVHGQEYAIADIGLRMLSPRELFRAQGFPEDCIIGDDPEQGLHLTKTAQVRMCGNSVCPPVSQALVAANFTHELQIARTA